MFEKQKRRISQREGSSLLRQFLSDEEGISAVEFALIALPFFMLIMGIFEICMIFMVATVLEYGAREAAREIRTGAFQSSGANTLADFESNICAEMLNLFGCDTRLHVNVTQPANFPTTPDPIPLDGTGALDTSGFSMATNGRDQIVVVSVYYEWELFTPLISSYMANMPGNVRLLISTQVFRNEPF